MTIEVPQPSLPQGGAECPPGENLVASPVGVPTSSLTLGANGDGEKPSTAKGPTPTRKRGKTKTSWSRRAKNKRPKKSQAKNPTGSAVTEQELEQGEPSKDTTRVSGGEEVVLGSIGRANGGSSSGGKTSDLNKRTPPKANKSPPDGSKLSKDEAASRKSLRLKLKNFKPDFKDADPRYFENLMDIDFEDEGQKVIFLQALGLRPCPPSKLSGKAEEAVGQGVPIPMLMKPGENSTFGNQSSAKSSCGHPQSSFPSSPSGSEQDKDEDWGWARWVDRLPVHEPIKTEASSQDEINEFLQTLKALGTEVKLVTSV